MSKRAESDLLQPLLEWLASRGWLGSRSVVVDELPWSGRRVDLVTVTSKNRTTAYELKLNGTRRAIQQASYNRLAFDRAYVVTAAMPTEESLCAAQEAGVGVILADGTGIRIILEAPTSQVESRRKRKLVRVIREAHDVREPVFALS